MTAWDHDALSLKVREIIADSLCVDLEEAHPGAVLIDDLGAESIDFLDIIFKLEKEFSISIPHEEIEKQARGDLTPEEFEKDGVLQPKAIAQLRKAFPEVDPELFKEGMLLRELPRLFTVKGFIAMVAAKIDQVPEGIPLTGGSENIPTDVV